MLKTCSWCNRMFEDYLGNNTLCQDCRDKEETLLRAVKDYLWDNPGATETKLGELFDIPRGRISKWLRDGRIELTPDSAIKLRCLRCGSMITSGKYCPDCAERIKNGFEEAIERKEFTSALLEEPKKDKNSKMHFI